MCMLECFYLVDVISALCGLKLVEPERDGGADMLSYPQLRSCHEGSYMEPVAWSSCLLLRSSVETLRHLFRLCQYSHLNPSVGVATKTNDGLTLCGRPRPSHHAAILSLGLFCVVIVQTYAGLKPRRQKHATK